MATSREETTPTHSFSMDDITMETSVDCSSKSRASVQLELERKLRCRADRQHLVQMNILPAVSTAPVLLAQTHKLQRQRTADTLQQKLRDRASRSELYQRNILPDSKLFLDPSLSATQKQLHKKRIADNLNIKISNRPGVLDLVEGNIIEPHLGRALEFLNESGSPENPHELGLPLATPSPTTSLGLSLQSNESNRNDQKFSDSSSPILSPGDTYKDDQKSPLMLFSPPSVDIPTPPSPPPILNSKLIKMHNTNHHPCKAPSPSQARKRQHKPKYRKLRYHEYIPPSKSGAKGGKTNSISKSSQPETPYSLLLQQQQLFLQLQVLQQQYPNGVLVQKLPELLKNMPASLTEKAQALLKPKTAGMENSIRPITKTHEIPEDIKVRNLAGNGTVTVRLDELKVNALKAACKEQNLIVSGKKVELIERLLEHNNGVLPGVVLSDAVKERRQSFMGHSISVDSQKSNSNSPQSPDQDSLFQFPGKVPSTPMDAISDVGSPMVTSLMSGHTGQQDFEKMVEKKKIDYLSANGPKTIAPKPMGITQQPRTTDPLKVSLVTSSSFNHSKSLPTTPQQLSPAGSTDNILHELMEQSPRPHPPPQPHQVHNKSPDSLLYHNPQLSQQVNAGQFAAPVVSQRRSGRASLPNPPPYPGVGIHNPNFVSNDLTGSGGHFSGYPQHLLPQRSVSLSGPSSSKPPQLSSILVAETNTSNNGLVAAGSSEPFNTTEDSIGLNELMEMETDFNDLFKILEKEDPSTSGLAQTQRQSVSFDQSVQRMPLPHQDSTQSDSVMFGVPINQSLKSNSLEFLPSLDGHDPKISATNGTSAHGNFNELGGMLNLDSSLLGSSPHLQGYFPESQNMAGHQSPYDYFQNGLIDDISFKPSSSTLTDFSTGLDPHHQLMESSQFGGISGSGLFGTSDPTFLDMNLTS